MKLLGQLALLVLISFAGNKVAAFTGLPLPGNVVGLVLLYVLLNLGLVRLDQVQEAADLLLRHLVFFFIPVAVDLMNWGGLFTRHGWVLALAIVLSTLLTFLTTGFMAQWLQKEDPPCLT